MASLPQRRWRAGTGFDGLSAQGISYRAGVRCLGKRIAAPCSPATAGSLALRTLAAGGEGGTPRSSGPRDRPTGQQPVGGLSMCATGRRLSLPERPWQAFGRGSAALARDRAGWPSRGRPTHPLGCREKKDEQTDPCQRGQDSSQDEHQPFGRRRDRLSPCEDGHPDSDKSRWHDWEGIREDQGQCYHGQTGQEGGCDPTPGCRQEAQHLSILRYRHRARTDSTDRHPQHQQG
jgi:hypothetical protein